MDGFFLLWNSVRRLTAACLVSLALAASISAQFVSRDIAQPFSLVIILLGIVPLLAALMVRGREEVGGAMDQMILAAASLAAMSWLLWAALRVPPLAIGVISGLLLVMGLFTSLWKSLETRFLPAVMRDSTLGKSEIANSVSREELRPIPIENDDDVERHRLDSFPVSPDEFLDAVSSTAHDGVPDTEVESTAQVFRFEREDCDCQEGRLRMAFAAGAKEQLIHLVFSPPFEKIPEVEMEDLTEGSLELEALAIYRFGARFKARLAQPANSTLTFEVGYQAVAMRKAA